MEYTIQKFAAVAGVTTRTIRYYDEIGILKPARINSNGYRIYGREQVERLQQIMFYRELGMDLDHMKLILDSPEFNVNEALEQHLTELKERRRRIDMLIHNVSQSLLEMEGKFIMKDKDRFMGFKEDEIKENELKYGKEIRKKYGDNTIEESNVRFINMDKETFDEMKKLEKRILEQLKIASKTEDTCSKEAKELLESHKRWLQYTWKTYSKEAHVGLALMYVSDERFCAYYENAVEGGSQFLHDVIVDNLSQL